MASKSHQLDKGVSIAGGKFSTAKNIASNVYRTRFKRKFNDKIVIAGPGRSGTSFLTLILTRMGYDTGYAPYNEDFNPHIRAGLEYDLFTRSLDQQKKNFERAPTILKHPEYSFRLESYLKAGVIGVKHVIIPVRDSHMAAKSRIQAGLYWPVKGINDDDMTIQGQRRVVSWALGKIVETCVKYDLPHTYILFPRMITDKKYCYEKLNPIFKLDKKKFDEVFVKTANLALIRNK